MRTIRQLLLAGIASIFLCGQVFGAPIHETVIKRGKADNCTIGQTNPAAGSFTTLEADILKLDHNVETLAAGKTLVITDKVIQRLDPAGTDRPVLLPPENTATDLVFFIYNMGGEVGEDLNIQDDAAAALETVHYRHFGICTCDGTTWEVRCLSCTEGIDVLSLRVKEENTSPLVIGQPVYTSGATGVAFPTVGLADCDDANKIEVVGLVAEAISQNTTGYARVHGLLEAVDSTKGNAINPDSEDWTAGDQLYLSATVGGLTNVKPTSGRIIKVGIALTVEGANSKVLVDIHRNPIWAAAASGEDIVVRMGDSAGANKVSYRDYDNNEVMALDSYGAFLIKDANDTSIIKHVLEPGLGGRLTFGLDETARIMVICDAGDVDTDFGLSVQANPTLYIRNAGGTGSLSFSSSAANCGAFTWSPAASFSFRLVTDLAASDYFKFISSANIELTDTNAEQSWLYVEPKYNGNNTSPFNALQIKATETLIGSGGANLIKAGTSVDDDMFVVDNVGRICLAESSDPAALADHVFFYGKNVTGTAEAFAADAGANAAQLTPHNFTLFEPDSLEAYPWSYYAENKALGIKINVDMAGAVRAIENLTGKTFIYTQNIAKEIDLEKVYKDAWIKDYINAGTHEVEVPKIQALETVQIDVPIQYDVEVPYQVCDENGTCVDKIKIVKQRKIIGEEIVGYELVEGEVEPKIEYIWETEKVDKIQVKQGLHFSEFDGQFYRTVKPTQSAAIAASETGFVFSPPKWLSDRLAK